MKVTIYHNPRCSKSRAALKLLEDRGIEPEVIEYLKTPPDRKTLTRLLKRLGIGPRELLRKTEPVYAEAGLANPNVGREALLDALIAHPILIERPIVVVDDKALIGRPPERVLEILGIL
jgi:arsenate reductase